MADPGCNSSINYLIDRYHKFIGSFLGYVESDPLHHLRPLNGLSKLRFASILVGLQYRNGSWSFLLTLRKSQLRVNAGDVCFPGGKFDKGIDTSMVDTALRESFEEIGLQKDQVRIIGQIPPIISRQGFLIHMVLGIIDDDFTPDINDDEVEDILYITTEEIISRDIHRQYSDKLCGVEITADYFDIEHGGHMYTIFGFTGAAISITIRELFNLDVDCHFCKICKETVVKSGGTMNTLMRLLQNFNDIAKM